LKYITSGSEAGLNDQKTTVTFDFHPSGQKKKFYNLKYLISSSAVKIRRFSNLTSEGAERYFIENAI
jgi:hypothetical protein